MTGYNNDSYNDSDILRKAREKIRKITTSWGYKYAIVGIIKKETNDLLGPISLGSFWIELYISKEIPTEEERKKAKSIKDLDKYNLEYVCTQVSDTLADVYIRLLRYLELMNISINYLRANKKEQNEPENT